jgi:hypothetical protein
VGAEQWINQNGTHYLFGCYTSTIGLLEAAYSVLAQHGDTRFGTFDEQLVPRDLLVIRQLWKGAWTDWTIPMPRMSRITALAMPTTRAMTSARALSTDSAPAA